MYYIKYIIIFISLLVYFVLYTGGCGKLIDTLECVHQIAVLFQQQLVA